MAPAGGVKGAMLALTVELLCCALTGAAYGFEADSFFAEEGNRPRVGQAFLIVDPDALGGGDVYFQRIEVLIDAMLADPEVRLPGVRRFVASRQAHEQGLDIPDELLAKIRLLAG